MTCPIPPDEDLSSHSRAGMLTKPGEPHAEADPEGGGMLGLFATEFQVAWGDGSNLTVHPTFEEARAAVRDNQWGRAVQIDRVETVWVQHRTREEEGS